MVDTLRVEPTVIDGLLVVHLPVHGDQRGWFKEHWQRAKMVAAGLPDFGPVQQNVSYNELVGTTRGIHGEPWDKYVSVAHGRAFGAWVDLRQGPGFGQVVTLELTPEVAVFVPRGVGNAFQTLEPHTSYMYLVNDHWSPNATYTLVNLFDPELGINWPIPADQAIISDKDRHHPPLTNVDPIPPRDTVVLGANGQLGSALRDVMPPSTTRFLTRSDLDLTDLDALRAYDWNGVDTIINAAAYTDVDGAETQDGRQLAWLINAEAVSVLAHIARDHNITFVNISTDYVFDGTKEEHTEDEIPAPLNVYGQSKAAGEYATKIAPKHYIIRTSWVIGNGHNFVDTMINRAKNNLPTKVVNDQHGRLTFTNDLAQAIHHITTTNPPHGTYHYTNTGTPTTWYHIAQQIFAQDGSIDLVRSVSTSDYNQLLHPNLSATRPAHGTLSLSKSIIKAVNTHSWNQRLDDLLKEKYV